MKQKVLLIDGNSFCYRAFYAIKSLSTSKGQPTNAIYGFVTMLNKLITEHKPRYLAVTFDLKGPTFRHKKFADYKAHRKPMPDDLSAQMPVIKKILKAYGIAIFEKAGYEADDVIATLVNRLANLELEFLIVTGDKDILQIVKSNVKVLNPQKEDAILDESWVRRRYGVSPEKIIEIMALAGDATDNIPGVPGIGETTAMELIKKYGTLEGVLANAERIPHKTKRQNLKESASLARMSRELVILDNNIRQFTGDSPDSLLKKLEIAEADEKKLLDIFKELEFKALMQKLAPEYKDKVDYQVISHCGQLKQHLKGILKEHTIAVYLWASQPEPMLAKIQGLAFALEGKKSLFFSFEQISPEDLKPILENKNIKKIGHNLKYAKVLLSGYGISLEGISFDTMIASYLLEPEGPKFNLEDLALKYLDCKLADAQEAGANLPKVCSQNAGIIFRLSNILQDKLKQKNLLALFQNIELPLIEVLADIEREGVALDKSLLLHLSRDFENRLKTLTKEIHETVGESFNINSPKQLSSILFEKLKLPIIKRTKTGNSTNTEVLQKLAEKHPVASTLLQFRELSKLKSTYVDGMLKLLNPQTGKIHTSFNQTGTSTGRLSSSRPNLQNIPIKTKLGKKIRQVFIPAEKDNLLLSADYSQIELRIVAHLSQDKNLISAFKQELDIHAHTASLIFNSSPDKISAQMRDMAKTVNFGIIYGMSAYGLARDLGAGIDQAQEFIDAYFQRYSGVKKYINHQIEKAKRHGYVTTLLNRRRYIPQIKSVDERVRSFAQRAAINAPVQGSASDLIKAAMVEIHSRLKAEGLCARMIIQVHDELLFSVSHEELEKVKALIKDRMENVIKLGVPIKVSIKTGKNWLEIK